MKLDKNNRIVRRLAISSKDNINKVDLGMRQVYILPTLKGLYYLVTLLIMFIWSMNFAISLGYAVTFLAGVFFWVISVYTVKNLTQTQVTALENKDFFAGSHSYFKIRVHTKDNQPKIQLVAGRNGVFSKKESATKNKEIIFKLPLHKSTRGIHNLDYVKIYTSYPIGIFRCWIWIKFDKQIIIYPKPNRDIPITKTSISRGDSNTENQPMGRDDFFGLREYQSGDSIQLIAWKKSTKGKLLLKEFNDQKAQQYSFNYNHLSLKNLSKEERLSQLCKWILMAAIEQSSYELILPNKIINRNSGTLHKTQCLRALACY